MRRSLAGLAHALVLLLSAACGGGGGGGGGPGDTVAQGTITATGSVTVTGTLFDTEGAVIEGIGGIDEPAALATGMQVTVEGTRDGDEGTADLVTFDIDLEGPVSDVVVVDDDTIELTVLEQTVVIEEPITLFDGTSFGAIAVGEAVEVSGLRDGDGAILATWVREVAAGGPVSLEGFVEGLIEDSFMIGPIEIGYDDDGVGTELPGVPEGGLANGDFVDVTGTLLDADTVMASVVELEARAIPGSRADVQVEGIVAEFADVSDFLVGGQPVDAGSFGVEFELDFLSADLDDGSRVEVEGRVQDGLLIARAVKLRAGEVRIAAAIGDPMMVVDAEAGTLEILDDAATPEILDGATLETDGATRFDGFGGLGDLLANDLLEVRGIDLGDVVRPTEIRRVGSLAAVRVVGRVEAFDGGPRVFTIAGVEMATDDETTYLGFPGTVGTEAQFYGFLSACSGALLEVTDMAPADAASLDDPDTIELLADCPP